MKDWEVVGPVAEVERRDYLSEEPPSFLFVFLVTIITSIVIIFVVIIITSIVIIFVAIMIIIVVIGQEPPSFMFVFIVITKISEIQTPVSITVVIISQFNIIAASNIITIMLIIIFSIIIIIIIRFYFGCESSLLHEVVEELSPRHMFKHQVLKYFVLSLDVFSKYVVISGEYFCWNISLGCFRWNILYFDLIIYVEISCIVRWIFLWKYFVVILRTVTWMFLLKSFFRGFFFCILFNLYSPGISYFRRRHKDKAHSGARSAS